MKSLTKVQGGWGETLSKVPAGPNREFHAQAFDASLRVAFEATSSGVTISADQTAEVIMSLQPVAVCPWTPAGAMASPRTAHTATLLSNGKVLVAGGRSEDRAYLVMGEGRSGHTATLLRTGQVLVTGDSATRAVPSIRLSCCLPEAAPC